MSRRCSRPDTKFLSHLSPGHWFLALTPTSPPQRSWQSRLCCAPIRIGALSRPMPLFGASIPRAPGASPKKKYEERRPGVRAASQHATHARPLVPISPGTRPWPRLHRLVGPIQGAGAAVRTGRQPSSSQCQLLAHSEISTLSVLWTASLAPTTRSFILVVGICRDIYVLSFHTLVFLPMRLLVALILVSSA